MIICVLHGCTAMTHRIQMRAQYSISCFNSHTVVIVTSRLVSSYRSYVESESPVILVGCNELRTGNRAKIQHAQLAATTSFIPFSFVA